MKDIAPELLEKIKNNFNEKFDSSKKIKSLYKKVKEGKADYEEAQKFAQETGRILSQAFQNNLSSNELPNGKLYYNIANRVIREMLEMDFDLVANLSVEVQNAINKKASINIKGIKPKLNKEKVGGIIDLVSGKDVFDDISYMLDEPIVNFTQSVVDDTVKTNAKFQYEAGLNPRIRRTSKNNCCEWCNKLAGEYNYEETKGTDVYRRHTNCNCLVEFIPGNGKKQNVHTKKWSREVKYEIVDPSAKEQDIVSDRKSKLIRTLAFSEANKRGYNPISEDKVVNILREKSEKWIRALTDREKRAITKYTFNGVDDDGKKLFEKINGYLANNYIPVDKKEESMILNFYANIKGAILKNELEDDIIVYRKDSLVSSLKEKTERFLSTSVTIKGALGGKPNVAIIVPKGTAGAYIELLSQIPKQREFLLDVGMTLKEILKKDGITILEVVKNNEN